MRSKTKSLSPGKGNSTNKRGRSLKLSRYSENPYINETMELIGRTNASPIGEEYTKQNEKIKELTLEMHRENCKI
jgi:hypothetical protein